MATLTIKASTKELLDEVRRKGESDDGLIRRLVRQVRHRRTRGARRGRAGRPPSELETMPEPPRTPETPPPMVPDDLPRPGTLAA